MNNGWLRAFVLGIAACAGMVHAADISPPTASGAAGAKRAPQAAASGTKASVESSANPDFVTLNFVDAEIEGVVKVVSEITRKNFVLDPRVKGTINIISVKPMSRALVYDVFLSALRLQGFAAVEDRGVTKIVPESDAKLHQSVTTGPREKARPGGDQIRTQVFALKYESAAQLLPILRPLIAPNNTISAYPNNNTLVITDYANNLQRIEKIIESIDQPSGTDPVVIPLRSASALDVVQTVNRLFAETGQVPGGAETAQRMMVVADTRSNSLIVRSENPARLTSLRSLVAMLDSPTRAAGNMHVVHLKNADAVKVAETLRAIYYGETSSPNMTARAIPATPVSVPSAATTQSPFPPPSPSGTSVAPPPQGIIQADAATNSIIITAPDAIYNNLRAVLEKLDARRAQVYVEALIAEISADKTAEFGIQWQNLSALGNTGTGSRAFGGTNFGGTGQNIVGITQDPTAVSPGLNIGLIRGRITIPGVGQILDLRALIHAMETNNNANILSTPTLLTLDNEEAKIVIGQNVPFITGQYALSGAATTPTPFQTIERRDVGLTLRIKPQISEGGTVRMQIFQEVSSIDDKTNVAGVITNKRAVESTVLVDDGQIVVIGGLIQDTFRDGVDKVPVLGDIPFLGNLFQSKTRSRNKTNLMVFLRPTVLRDAARANGLTNERYDYILGEQLKDKPARSPLLPNVESPPSLPPRPAPAVGEVPKP